jgi:hypothetical protein
MYEYCELLAGEHNVRLAREAGVMEAVSKTLTPEPPPDEQFRSRIL